MEGNYYNLFPEDIGLDKNLLFLLFKPCGYIYKSIKKFLKEHKRSYKFIHLKLRRKIDEYVIIYRNRNKLLDNALRDFIEYSK